MDLNYLLHRQQVEKTRAEVAANEPSRRAHAELARLYAERIGTITGGRLKIRDH